MSTSQPLPASRQQALSLRRPTSVALYDDYSDAQMAVDYLADRAFPVQALAIVGTDLRTIERVTGRLTMRRVLTSGFLQGATWAGMFAIFMWLFIDGMNLLNAFAFGIISFGLVGMGMAWLGYRQRGGDRDFTSLSAVIATHYEVLAESDVAARARNLLSGGQAHPTIATTMGQTDSQSKPPAPETTSAELASFAPPFGQQPMTDAPAPENFEVSERTPEQDSSAAISQPYGRYWAGDDTDGIGNPPADEAEGFGAARRSQPED